MSYSLSTTREHSPHLWKKNMVNFFFSNQKLVKDNYLEKHQNAIPSLNKTFQATNICPLRWLKLWGPQKLNLHCVGGELNHKTQLTCVGLRATGVTNSLHSSQPPAVIASVCCHGLLWSSCPSPGVWPGVTISQQSRYLAKSIKWQTSNRPL